MRLVVPLSLAVLALPVCAAAQSDYRLADHDLIEIQVFNQPDMTARQRVTSSGELRLPLIGTVKVAGKTLREAEQELESRYEAGGFFVNPQVILAVAEYGARFVSVLGEVKNPVRMPFPPEAASIGVVQAITEAGGFTRVARSDNVQIIRRREGGEQRITLNLEKALAGDNSRDNTGFQLLPGDIVYVPERLF
ncbi:MAG TPA: polysaccharide biosynthesis/export family protein [Opitutus sp.]|nr:polysaccharide biosynthesis/export family protein [Opitutus sp.]